MARGPRKPIDSRIQEIDERIEKHRSSIKALESKKDSLLESQKKNEINSLYNFIQEKNIGIEEAFEILSAK